MSPRPALPPAVASMCRSVGGLDGRGKLSRIPVAFLDRFTRRPVVIPNTGLGLTGITPTGPSDKKNYSSSFSEEKGRYNHKPKPSIPQKSTSPACLWGRSPRATEGKEQSPFGWRPAGCPHEARTCHASHLSFGKLGRSRWLQPRCKRKPSKSCTQKRKFLSSQLGI